MGKYGLKTFISGDERDWEGIVDGIWGEEES